MQATITDVPGILVGHSTNQQAGTGCTVVLAPEEGMQGAVFVRGRATASRELGVLSPRHLVANINAILLTGGSAFGLGAADGVMRWLAERGRGVDVGVGVVPIVPAAAILDLAFGEPKWPDADAAYGACDTAGVEVAEGSVGAGTGATVGNVLGADGMMKGGVGIWAERRGDVVVGAIAVVNAFGDVRDAEGRILAGARGPDGFVDARRYLANGGVPFGALAGEGANTTLVVVATNTAATRLELQSVAQMAADALGQRITPVGTAFDGDIVFAVSAGETVPATQLEVEMLAQQATATAIERAVWQAKGTDAVPGLGGK
jgi:L-aminopeptidase/D-esterase-like protein